MSVSKSPETTVPPTQVEPKAQRRVFSIQFKRSIVEQAAALLTEHMGTVAAVADGLGVSRRQVQRWMERYELDADSFRRHRS